ncbi:MAG: O-antigen ligase family protein [Rhodospirillales bacterium]|nr:O-antigen ligase family protein [Rhodospirillales bacterium]
MSIRRIDESHILGVAFAIMTPVSVISPKGMAVVLAATALGLASLRLAGGWRFNWQGSMVGKLIAAFVILCFLSAIWSIAPEKTLKTAAIFASEAIGGTLIILAATRLNVIQRTWVVHAICFGLAVAMAALFFEYLSGNALRFFFLTPENALEWKKIAHFKVYNASMTVIVLTTLPASLLIFRLGHRLLASMALAGLLGLTVIADADTSRVALVFGVVVVAVACWAPRIATVGLMTVLVIGILAGPAVLKETPPLQKYVDVLPQLPNSTYHRLIIWEEVVDRIWQRPVIGFGFDSSRGMTDAKTSQDFSLTYRGKRIYEIHSEPIPLHPHNAALQVWLELGGLGATLYTAILLVLVRLVGRSNSFQGAVGLGTLTTAIFISFTAYGAWQSWWQATLWMVAAVVALSFTGKVRLEDP